MSGEFGNETATAALKLQSKAIEALMKFFKFLLERQEKKINAEIQKERLYDVKLKKGERLAKLKVEGKVGYVKAKLLQKTGDPLVAIKINLNDQQMKDFARLAKKYGLLYTSISDTRKSGEKVHTFYVREKDLQTAKIITDRMTEELQLKSFDDAINEIKAKGELSEKDLADIKYYEKCKDTILKNGTREFNDENAEIIFNDVCGEMQDKALSFDKALNRFTDRDFSRDEPYYMCERTNPTSYIELRSTLDEFAGEQYTRTDYRVFKNDVEQTADLSLRKDGQFTDERFSGRPKGFWQSIKDDMKSKGGFSDDVVVFNNKAEFDKYKQLYIESAKQNEIHENRSGEYRDYSSINEQLKKHLDEFNADVNSEGIAIDKGTQKILDIADAKTHEESLRIAESILIAKQLQNYKKMAEIELAVAMDKQSLETVSNEQDARDLTSKIAVAEKELQSRVETEHELSTARNQLSGVEAVYEIEEQQTNEREVELEKVERTDREERADANDRDTRTMDEWKGQMSEKRESAGQATQTRSVEKSLPSKDER